MRICRHELQCYRKSSYKTMKWFTPAKISIEMSSNHVGLNSIFINLLCIFFIMVE